MPGFKQTILEFKTPASAANIGTSVKKGKKLKEGRTWGVQHLDLCDGTPLGQTGSAGGVGSAGGKVGLETSGAVGGVTGAGEVGAAGRGSRSALAVGEGAESGSGSGACVDVLKEIRAQGAPVCYSLFLILLRYSSFSFIIPHYSSLFLVIPRISHSDKNHWDVIGATIDIQPTSSAPSSTSLSALKTLDLTFMRPKYILVRIGPRTYADLTVSTVKTASALLEDVRYAVRYLRRTGFMVNQEGADEDLCGEGAESVGVEAGGGSVIQIQGKEPKGLKKKYVCVWGTRMNNFEFSGEKWGQW